MNKMFGVSWIILIMLLYRLRVENSIFGSLPDYLYIIMIGVLSVFWVYTIYKILIKKYRLIGFDIITFSVITVLLMFFAVIFFAFQNYPGAT